MLLTSFGSLNALGPSALAITQSVPVAALDGTVRTVEVMSVVPGVSRWHVARAHEHIARIERRVG